MSTRLFPFLPPSPAPQSPHHQESADRDFSERLKSSAMVAGIMDFSFQKDSNLDPRLGRTVACASPQSPAQRAWLTI